LKSWAFVVILQVVGLLIFDYSRESLSSLSGTQRVAVFFFQAMSNRSGGFSIVDVNQSSSGM
jgi:Trk-type K+ transport system membrane component